MMTEVRMRDFSRKVRELGFTADGETYTCLPAIPPVSLQEILRLVRGRMHEDWATAGEFFDIVMDEGEAARIKKRLDPDNGSPLDLHQILDIAKWLIAEHSQRPTTPSATSSDGLQTEETGISSTDGAQDEA